MDDVTGVNPYKEEYVDEWAVGYITRLTSFMTGKSIIAPAGLTMQGRLALNRLTSFMTGKSITCPSRTH